MDYPCTSGLTARGKIGRSLDAMGNFESSNCSPVWVHRHLLQKPKWVKSNIPQLPLFSFTSVYMYLQNCLREGESIPIGLLVALPSMPIFFNHPLL